MIGTARRAALWCLGALAAWAVLATVLPDGAPAGIILSGVVLGAINGLLAISVVLVYRANRVLNFAAAEFGSVAAVLAIEFHIKLHMNYFLCVGCGLVISALLGGLLELTIIRRFAKAPRLIVAVATIGLAQLLDGVSVIIPAAWSKGSNGGSFTTPFSAKFRIYPVVFDANYIVALVVIPVALLGLVWFLRYTHYGVAIRAAAENGDRAKLLGIPVLRLSTVVWTITGVLSALAVLLRVPILGFTSFTSVSEGGTDLLVQTFAAAVIGGMTSLPVTLAAAIGIGIVDQLSAWTFANATYVDVTLLVVILVALLARRDRLTRAADTGISTWQTLRPVRAIPAELAKLAVVRRSRVGLRVAIVALAVGLPYLASPSRTQLASDVIVYAIIACSLVVLTGWAGHISLGQIALMGFGAATTGVLLANHGWDIFPALLAGMGVAAVFAVLIGIPALRISGEYLAVVTLAFGAASAAYFLVPQYFSWFIPSGVGRPVLFGRINISSDRAMYFVCLVGLALVLAAIATLRRSELGRAIVAAKENRLATQAIGLETVRLNLVAFAVSGAIAGLAGGLFVVLQEGYNFGSFSADQGITFFMMVVIGGLGSIPGAVLGALYVYGAQYLLPAGYSVLATAIGLLVLLMFLPGGLGDLVYRWRDSLLRMVARQRNIVVPSLVADVMTTVDARASDAHVEGAPIPRPAPASAPAAASVPTSASNGKAGTVAPRPAARRVPAGSRSRSS